MSRSIPAGSEDKLDAGWYLHYHEGGRLVQLHSRNTLKARPSADGNRRKCSRFTLASRRRLMRKVAAVDSRRFDCRRWLFVTLTYPGQVAWPEEPAVWKDHLDAFLKRLKRHMKGCAGFWKLEPQRRGAPHFHLIVIPDRGEQIPDGMLPWVSKAWFEVVGSGEHNHLKAGTNVQRVRTIKGATHYAAKYCGKVCDFINEETGEVREVGRFWGSWNYNHVCGAARVFELSPDCAIALRRWLRRLAGLRAVGRLQGLTVYCEDHVAPRLLAGTPGYHQEVTQSWKLRARCDPQRGPAPGGYDGYLVL